MLERPGVRFADAWRTLFILPWAIPEVVGAVAWHGHRRTRSRALIAQLVGDGRSRGRDRPELSLLVLLVAGDVDGLAAVDARRDGRAADDPALVHEAAELEGAGALARCSPR